MTLFARAFAVHLLTASGAVLAMLAILAAAKSDWAVMYFWLVIAFVVDGIDGPLARAVDVKRYAPQWDGVLLDLIIDYLTYVFIPAYALFVSGLFVGWSEWLSVGVIVFTAVIYFADTRMKTDDNSFSGFPGCWNMVVLVFFAFEPHWQVMLWIVLILSLLQFVPLRFIHPVRTERWRWVSLPMIAIWTISAVMCALGNFDGISALWTGGLLVSTLYLLLAGAVQQFIPPRG